MSDDFIRLGTPKQEWTAVVREKEKIGSRSYLWTTVAAPVRSAARFLAGGMTPAAVWLRGRRVAVEEFSPHPEALRIVDVE